MSLMSPLTDHLNRRRLRRLLDEYPIYSPPHTGDTETWCEQKMTENFVFFCETKARRLETLKAFFAEFSIDLARGLDCAMDIGQWLHVYGRLGFKKRISSSQALHDFDPDWSGDYRILNLVFDLAAFAGEIVIESYSLARWDLLTQEIYGGITDMPGYGHPCLFGVANKGYGYPVYMPHMVRYCFEGAIWHHRHGLVFSDWDKPDGFRKLILYLSGSKIQ